MGHSFGAVRTCADISCPVFPPINVTVLFSLPLSLILWWVFYAFFITSGCHCPYFLVTLAQRIIAFAYTRDRFVFFAFSALKWQLTLAFNRTDLLWPLPFPSLCLSLSLSSISVSLSLTLALSFVCHMAVTVCWPSNCGPSVCTFIWRQAVIVVCITTDEVKRWVCGFPAQNVACIGNIAAAPPTPPAFSLPVAKCERRRQRKVHKKNCMHLTWQIYSPHSLQIKNVLASISLLIYKMLRQPHLCKKFILSRVY